MKCVLKILLVTFFLQLFLLKGAQANLYFSSPEDFREKVLNNLNTSEARNYSYDFFTCLKGINGNSMVFTNSSRVKRIDGRSADCLGLAREADYNLNRYFFKRNSQEFITHCTSRVTNDGDILLPYTCNHSSYCSSGCPRVVPEGLKLLRNDVLQELQNNLLKESQEEKQKLLNEQEEKLKKQQDQQAKINELKSRKYSRLPAKLKVESQDQSQTINVYGMPVLVTATTVIITSVDNEPFLFERVVINNKTGVNNCDVTSTREMTTGDVLRIGLDGCGAALVKVDVYTNRGSSTYNFK